MTAIHRQVEDARNGRLDNLVARTHSGWVILAEAQVLRGYCLLLPDPVVGDLNALRGPARAEYLTDMAAVGDALLALTPAVRINYEILGNVEPALHAHVIPRYADEPEALRRGPIWNYDFPAAPRVDRGRDGGLMDALRAALGAARRLAG
ncbi:MAG: HIT family protein [Gammaproteobacteria bacterium]